MTRPEGWPDDQPWEPMTRERFEQVLLGIRNASSVNIAALISSAGGLTADQRAVWHAAEVALGILHPGYVPKREAVDDLRSLLDWLDGNNEGWPATD